MVVGERPAQVRRLARGLGSIATKAAANTEATPRPITKPRRAITGLVELAPSRREARLTSTLPKRARTAAAVTEAAWVQPAGVVAA